MKYVLIAAIAAFLSFVLPTTAQTLKPKHQAVGLECQTCHTPEQVAKGQFEPAPSAQCLSCHGPAEDLAKRTARLDFVSEMVDPKTGAKSQHKAKTNPHDSFHFSTQLDCYECHREHRPSKNECATCHDTKPWGMKPTP